MIKIENFYIFKSNCIRCLGKGNTGDVNRHEKVIPRTARIVSILQQKTKD
jgi:hypothetical protein